MKKILLSFSLILLAQQFVNSQCKGWNWPDDEATARQKIALYTDALNNKNYQAAAAPHRWLLQNAPDLNNSIYINGVKIFSERIEQEENEVKKQELIDSLMLIYDMRMEHCGEKEKVMNRKAFDAYRYRWKNKEKLPGLLSLYDVTFEMDDENIDYYIAFPYMHLIYQVATQNKNLSQEEIYSRYERITNVLEQKMLEDKKNKEKIIKSKADVDDLFIKIYTVDCDFVRENLGPKFKANPDDLNTAKRIFTFMLAGKCTDDPLWVEAAKKINEEEPNYGIAKNIAIKCLVEKDFACAEKYFNQALKLAEGPDDKADIYMNLAKLEENRNNYSAARKLYLKAAQAGRTDAYKNIGLLYFNSFNMCKKEEDQVKDRAVFLAAYDMFQKAGARDMMAQAKEQFPSKGEIFDRNYERGQTINTGCWIGETTTIRARDE
ncbi:MAG: hypothetical protein ACNS60_09425 [Candidatus Cyclobacteriaceae bacterium M2_1C_046]